MKLFALPPLLSSLFALLLGVFILLKRPSSPVKRTFALLCFETFYWHACWVFTYFFYEPHQKDLIMRLAWTVITFIPVTYYEFAIEFLDIRKERRVVRILYSIAALFLIPLWTSNTFISGAVDFWFGYYPSVGPLHALYLVLVFGFLVRAVWLLLVALKDPNLSGIERNRKRFAFICHAVYFVTSLEYLINYRVPLYPVGAITMPAAFCVMVYAINRYQLLDIEIIVKRTLVFAGLVGSVVAVVSFMTFVSQDVLARFIQIPGWLSNVLAAAIIAGVYGPIRNRLVNVTDKYLFQKKYDYRELLRKFTDEVMVIVDLKDLLARTVKTLTEIVKLDGCSLLLLNKDSRRYELAASKGTNGQQLVLDEQEPFITFLRKTHEPIGLDGQLGKVRFPEAVTQRLSELNARLCLPLSVHDELIGVLSLGKKKSDEEFAKDDLDILLPLARTLAIAISNAELFDELAKTQAEAAQREKLAVIGTLSAGINHEICNPLGIVKAQCEAFLLDLQDGILMGKSPQELLDRTSNIMGVALKQIDRATAITQKLSNFAKPIKEPTAQPVSVAQEADEVLLLVGHDLKLEKIEVKKEIATDLTPITVDRRQFQEVLFNLIRNAAQAIAPPGMITIRARGHEGGVRIEIADTGSGIPPEKLGKIYDPFFTTKGPGKGTGLGLFIVRQIVERNKGRISVESAVGQGTTFFLDFPAVLAAAQPGIGANVR